MTVNEIIEAKNGINGFFIQGFIDAIEGKLPKIPKMFKCNAHYFEYMFGVKVGRYQLAKNN